MNDQSGVFAVIVDVALSRPPRVEAQVFVQVQADDAVEAIKLAAQMAALHPLVVMSWSSCAASGGGWRWRTRSSSGPRPTSPGRTHADLVQRRFAADEPNRLWVTDITQHPTGQGFVYCAVVLDVSSRRVVGWSIADHLRTELVVHALDMARWRRRPPAGQTVLHSDRGSTPPGLSVTARVKQGCSAAWDESTAPPTTPWSSRSSARCNSS